MLSSRFDRIPSSFGGRCLRPPFHFCFLFFLFFFLPFFYDGQTVRGLMYPGCARSRNRNSRGTRSARCPHWLTEAGCNDPGATELGHPRLFCDVVFARVHTGDPVFQLRRQRSRRRPRERSLRFSRFPPAVGAALR